MSVHQTRDGRWFCTHRDESGKQVREYFGRGDPAELLAKKRDEEVRALAGKDMVDVVTVADLCQAYHLRKHREDSTIKMDQYKFATLIACLGDRAAELLTATDLNEYVARRTRAEHVKRSTAAREIRLLKAVFSWAESLDPALIGKNPIARFRMKDLEAKDVPFPPSTQEMIRVLAKSPEHLYRALMIFWYTGTRPGTEIYNLRWKDFDHDNRLLRITGARKGGPAIRLIPVEDESFLADLLRWYSEDKLTWPDRVDQKPVVHYRGNPVMSLKGAWQRAKKAAGVNRKLRLYDTRHRFVTSMIEAGIDLKTVSELAGHSRPDTTAREYLHVTPEQKRKAIQQLPALHLRPVNKC